MIKIEFVAAVSIFLSIILILVLGLWIFYTCNKDSQMAIRSEIINHCPICTCVFYDYSQKKVKICPNCKSYIDSEET
jgi:hypothetical protein